MKLAGPILAIVGILVIVLGLAQHFMGFLGTSIAHLSIYIGVVGVVLLIIGGYLTMSSMRASS
jgi:hypothetical protein